MKTSVYAMLLFALLSTSHAQARTLDVPGEFESIGEAMAAAVSADTVLVACGRYVESRIQLVSGVVLRSVTGDPACVTVDAERQGSVVLCDSVDATTVIRGITFTGGAAEDGGALNCVDSAPLVTSCVFSANEASRYGGALFALRSAPLITRCSFVGNSSESGGGAIVGSESDVSVRSCRLTTNQAKIGCSAIAVFRNSTLTAEDCVFFANNNWSCGPVSVCVAHESSAVITACTFAWNRCTRRGTGRGGHVVIDPLSSGDFERCIFRGVPIQCVGSGDVTLTCCDVYHLGSGASSLSEDFPCLRVEQGNFSADPLFADSQRGDFRLSDDSPCLPAHSPCGLLVGAPSGEEADWHGEGSRGSRETGK